VTSEETLHDWPSIERRYACGAGADHSLRSRDAPPVYHETRLFAEFLVRGRAVLVADRHLRDGIATGWFFTVDKSYPLCELLIETALRGERACASDWPPRYTSWTSRKNSDTP
jgi:hypothetical protein